MKAKLWANFTSRTAIRRSARNALQLKVVGEISPNALAATDISFTKNFSAGQIASYLF
jgi:hypothetical protein